MNNLHFLVSAIHRLSESSTKSITLPETMESLSFLSKGFVSHVGFEVLNFMEYAGNSEFMTLIDSPAIFANPPF